MKSTVAYQFCKIFQMLYPNSICVYIDIEGAANTSEGQQQTSRVHIMGIDETRFRYEPMLLDIPELFDLIDNLCQVKIMFEEKTQREFKLCIIWDSLAATSSSKTAAVDDHNKVIGFKARQLSFCIEKYAPLIAHNRVTFLTIDQVRANLQLEGQYVAKEQSVGTFNDYRAASSIAAWNHKVVQWLFLSKKAAITPNDGIGVNGWYMQLFTEKNKCVPSREAVTCVFDKRFGLHPFWSEYTFLSEMTRSETKYYKEEKKLVYPLAIKKATAQQYCLEFMDPETGAIQYTSEKFFKRDAFKKYQNDENFKAAFDHIMAVSVEQRIKRGIFDTNLKQDLEISSNSSLENLPDSTFSEEDENIQPMKSELNETVEQSEETISQESFI